MVKSGELYMAMDIGFDLGTTSIIIYVKGKGVVLNEPTIASIDTRTGDVREFGSKAYDLLGRTPGHIKLVAPLEEGVISDFSMAEQMIRYYVKKVVGNSFFKPRLTICVPTGITAVEAKAVMEAASSAGVRKVYLIESPVAAAIGANMEMGKPFGKMIVDSGGGTSEAAVISMNGVVAKSSVKVAGDKLDDALIRYIRSKHNILLGKKTAAEVKMTIGNVYESSEDVKMEVRGRNLVTGLPETVEISELETFIAYHEPIHEIAKMVQSVIERTPPELVADISENGIVLTGGTFLLKGFPKYLEHYLNVKTVLAEDPINAVAIGTGEAFAFSKDMTDGFINFR